MDGAPRAGAFAELPAAETDLQAPLQLLALPIPAVPQSVISWRRFGLRFPLVLPLTWLIITL